MELVVDLDRVTVVLADPERLDEMTVRVAAPLLASAHREADVHRLSDVLAATGTGKLTSSAAAAVSAEAVRFHAAGQVSGDWEERFAARWERGDQVPAADGGESLPAAVHWPPSGSLPA